MNTPQPDKTPKTKPESDAEAEKAAARKHEEELLDEGLEETFPASDPTAAQDPDVHQRRAEKGLD